MQDDDIVYHNGVKYRREVTQISINNDGKMIPLENLYPILTPKEYERRKKEIEQRLYNVFIKYQKKEV